MNMMDIKANLNVIIDWFIANGTDYSGQEREVLIDYLKTGKVPKGIGE